MEMKDGDWVALAIMLIIGVPLVYARIADWQATRKERRRNGS